MQLLKQVEKLILNIAVLLFSILIGIVLFQILARNLIGKSFAQLEELAIIILPWFGFFSATYTLYRGNHVQIDFFYNKMPRQLRRGWFCLLQMLLLGVLGAMCYYSYGLSMRQMKVVTPALGWPNGISYMGVAVCAPLMMLPLLYNIWRVLRFPDEDGQGIDFLHKEG